VLYKAFGADKNLSLSTNIPHLPQAPAGTVKNIFCSKLSLYYLSHHKMP